MPTSNGEELRLFLKCTVIGRGVFGRCACCVRMRMFLFLDVLINPAGGASTILRNHNRIH